MPDDKSVCPVPTSKRRSRQLRQIGLFALFLGVLAAGMIYWLGNRDTSLADKPSMQGFNRAERRQMGQLYGKSGLLIDEWSDEIKQPGTQAALLAGFSVAVFAACFYFARLLDFDDKMEKND